MRGRDAVPRPFGSTGCAARVWSDSVLPALCFTIVRCCACCCPMCLQAALQAQGWRDQGAGAAMGA